MLKGRIGLYAVILKISKPVREYIGKLGTHTFKPGFYVYVGRGSGRGSSSIEERVRRHTSKRKRVFWHIDHLTINPQVKVESAIYSFTDMISECKLTLQLLNILGGRLAVRGFGSSDCKCSGHLIFLHNLDQNLGIDYIIKMSSKAFSQLGLRPEFTKETDREWLSNCV